MRQYRPRFTRQLLVSHVNLEFACHSAKLAVELDGGYHARQTESDNVRTLYLEAQGWLVLRFWNSDVHANVEGVVGTILEAVARRSTHPQPLPFREGRTRRPRTE